MSQSTVATRSGGSILLGQTAASTMHFAAVQTGSRPSLLEPSSTRTMCSIEVLSAMHSSSCAQAFRRRHEHANIAVGKDVGDLLRLEQRVHRHAHAACGRGAEYCDDRLDALVEQHRHPIVATQPYCRQARRESANLLP